MIDLMALLEQRSAPEPVPASADIFVAFDHWTRDRLRAIVELDSREELAAGERLLEMGAEDDRALFVVVAGELEAYRPTACGEHRVIVLGPGDLIGEIAFIDRGPRSASVRALVPSVVLRIRPRDVETLAQRDPTLALDLVLEIARVLSFRLRRMSLGV